MTQKRNKSRKLIVETYEEIKRRVHASLVVWIGS
jgi:hypothetical protein